MKPPIEWVDNRVRILDQTELPRKQVVLEFDDYRDVAQAIKSLQVRGAPAIGVAAAYGIALGAQGIKAKGKSDFDAELNQIIEVIASTRPTAVNLFKAVTRMRAVAAKDDDVSHTKVLLVAEASKIHQEEEQSTQHLSQLGAELFENGITILTHCNAGPLATAGYGTAIGAIRAAKAQGKNIQVFATETRPLLQGARLTAWELMQDDIPTTLITDSMAGHFMNRGIINCAIVGADRITANGDVANKIGTYTMAVLAAANSIPFYVAAPLSTIDLSLSSGDEIPIEERNAEEVTFIRGEQIAPNGVHVSNPAFDVTPHRYVAAIITDRGVVKDPYDISLKALFET